MSSNSNFIFISLRRKNDISDIIYAILDEVGEWREAERKRLLDEKRAETTHPAKITILKDHIFRASKPAIVGVHVDAGEIRLGMRMIDKDGKILGRIKSIRSGEDTKQTAGVGEELAVAIDGITIGRQIDEEDSMWSDMTSQAARELRDLPVT